MKMTKKDKNELSKLLAKFFTERGLYPDGYVFNIKSKPGNKFVLDDRPEALMKDVLLSSPIVLLRMCKFSADRNTLLRFFGKHTKFDIVYRIVVSTGKEIKDLPFSGNITFKLLVAWLKTWDLAFGMNIPREVLREVNDELSMRGEDGVF